MAKGIIPSPKSIWTWRNFPSGRVRSPRRPSLPGEANSQKTFRVWYDHRSPPPKVQVVFAKALRFHAQVGDQGVFRGREESGVELARQKSSIGIPGSTAHGISCQADRRLRQRMKAAPPTSRAAAAHVPGSGTAAEAAVTFR
jgi:hypothetical protein